MVEVKLQDKDSKETHVLVLQPEDIKELTEKSAVINMPVEANHVRIFFFNGTRAEILSKFAEVSTLNHPK